MSFFFLHLIWFPGNDKFFYLVSPPLSCYKLVLNLEPVAGILLITIVNKKNSSLAAFIKPDLKTLYEIFNSADNAFFFSVKL